MPSPVRLRAARRGEARNRCNAPSRHRHLRRPRSEARRKPPKLPKRLNPSPSPSSRPPSRPSRLPRRPQKSSPRPSLSSLRPSPCRRSTISHPRKEAKPATIASAVASSPIRGTRAVTHSRRERSPQHRHRQRPPATTLDAGTDRERGARSVALPPAANDGSTRYGIEIGSVAKQDGCRPLWREFLTNHAALVAGLQPRRVLAPDKKWRLIAGPFSSAAEASQACALFKKASRPCEATVYAGDGL